MLQVVNSAVTGILLHIVNDKKKKKKELLHMLITVAALYRDTIALCDYTPSKNICKTNDPVQLFVVVTGI